ncbi:mammalian cell entry protein [Mycobacterium sp.]|uniref:mammalian cell entry protein n=1 Tax=Mycobacterium sp. TaxID=1785 RepID=UPI003D6B9D0C
MADDATDTPKGPVSVHLMAFAAGLIGVVVMAALAAWLGFPTYQDHQAGVRRTLFVQAARQGAVNLTTVDYEHADADAQRILDSATGSFHDHFSARWGPFVDLVKREQSKLVGTVSDAGLESQTGDVGQVLVAVTVKTSNPGQAQQEPQVWRMRITVQKVGEAGKISNVAFVS